MISYTLGGFACFEAAQKDGYYHLPDRAFGLQVAYFSTPDSTTRPIPISIVCPRTATKFLDDAAVGRFFFLFKFWKTPLFDIALPLSVIALWTCPPRLPRRSEFYLIKSIECLILDGREKNSLITIFVRSSAISVLPITFVGLPQSDMFMRKNF